MFVLPLSVLNYKFYKQLIFEPFLLMGYVNMVTMERSISQFLYVSWGYYESSTWVIRTFESLNLSWGEFMVK